MTGQFFGYDFDYSRKSEPVSVFILVMAVSQNRFLF